MINMGSKPELGFFVEGQSFMTQGSYATEAAPVSPEDCFGLIGCRDIAKETEDDINDWIFEDGPVDDDEESAGPDLDGLFGMQNFEEQNQFVAGVDVIEAQVREVCETTEDTNGILFDNFSFTDSDVEAEFSQPQATIVAFEGADVLEAAPYYFVDDSFPVISPASSLASLSVEKFFELLPDAFTHDADLDLNLDLQFAVPVYSDALTAYPEPQQALAPEEEKFFTDLLNDESYALAFPQEAFDFDFGYNIDAFAGVNTNVPAGHESCLDIGGQSSEPIYEMAEDVVGPGVGLYEQSELSSNEVSDLSLAYPSNMSLDNTFQTETGAMMVDANSSLADISDYTHTPASGGDEDLVPALGENDKNVPRYFSGDLLSANPIESDGFKVRVRDILESQKKKDPSELTAIKGAVAKGRKKGPRSPRESAASASSSTDRVTKPSGSRPKKPRRVKRVFDYSEANVDTIEVPCPELQNVLITREQLIKMSGGSFDDEKAKEGEINRRRFVRGSLDGLKDLHPNVAYEKNHSFDISKPYQQEFTRVELNPTTGTPIMETRSGLCCYCEDLHFYELKNSCYSQHMSHSHGVYTDNTLTPDAILPGKYSLAKKFTPGRKTIPHARDHDGVLCPVCLDVVETRCWASTSDKKPLSNYLRHFKDQHRVVERRETYFNLKA
ncbi:hypothetical protein OXX69_001034 [Metschnikowia pulcherrima]